MALTVVTHYGASGRFWKRAGYVPLYLRQTQSELTGEHTCVMVRGLQSSTEDELQWLREFAKGKLQGVVPFSASNAHHSTARVQTSGGGSCRFSPSSSVNLAASRH